MTDNFLDILEYTTSCKKFIEDVLGLQVMPFHEEWIGLFENNNFVCLLAPRGHGKSTIVESYIIWKILIDPNIRILITTVNQNKAEEMMAFIRHHLEFNEKILDLFGEQKSPLWSRNKLRVKNRGGGVIHKEPTLQVLGVTSSQISSHYDIIILDDVCDRNNISTAHRRRQLKQWYDTEILEMLEPLGKIFNIQTRWHEDDMHNYLSNKTSYVSKRYQAIVDEKNEIALWPERFTYDDLINLRDDQIGSVAFSMQYQNEIRQTEDSPIKSEWVEDALNSWDPFKIPTDGKRFIGVDLASKSSEGDYFSCIVVSKDAQGNYYVLDCIRDKVSMATQLDIIQSLNIKHNPLLIGIESNATQRIITDDWLDNTNLPILQLKSSWINDKWSRVQKLAVLLETHRMFIDPKLDILVDEMISFPRGMNDDTLDSLCFAIQSSESLEEKRTVNWDDVVKVVKAKRMKPYVHKI
jgi:predicted phage terminase large subunit-like protein